MLRLLLKVLSLICANIRQYIVTQPPFNHLKIVDKMLVLYFYSETYQLHEKNLSGFMKPLLHFKLLQRPNNSSLYVTNEAELFVEYFLLHASSGIG